MVLSSLWGVIKLGHWEVQSRAKENAAHHACVPWQVPLRAGLSLSPALLHSPLFLPPPQNVWLPTKLICSLCFSGLIRRHLPYGLCLLRAVPQDARQRTPHWPLDWAVHALCSLSSGVPIQQHDSTNRHCSFQHLQRVQSWDVQRPCSDHALRCGL